MICDNLLIPARYLGPPGNFRGDRGEKWLKRPLTNDESLKSFVIILYLIRRAGRGQIFIGPKSFTGPPSINQLIKVYVYNLSKKKKLKFSLIR